MLGETIIAALKSELRGELIRARRRGIRRGKKSLQRHDRPEAAVDCALR